MKKSLSLLPIDRIENKIFFIRGKKVILDRDLAELYGVEVKNLNRAVKRNLERFPSDFMFQLNEVETKLFLRFQNGTLDDELNLKCQIGTSSYGGRRKPPYAFTEQGIAMLSSVLNSERAIQVNIHIIRTFTKIRELVASNKELRDKLEQLEKKYDGKFHEVFTKIRSLINKPEPARKKIGFRT